jgi:hypothetical protein
MSTPVATIADALIAFILSLLRDPAAAEEFDAAPQSMLAGNGLRNACEADVKAVKPVIVDHPQVAPRSGDIAHSTPRPDSRPEPDPVVREIKSILQQFVTIDNRTTAIDQSTNQNIWTNGGDVTQIFDQEAVVAAGDHSIAAGDDVAVVDTEVDVDVHDVEIGNEHYTDSFNDTANGDGAVVEEASPATSTAETTATTSVDEAVGDAVGDAVDAALDTGIAATAQTSAAPPEPAPLAEDLTAAADPYEGDSGAVAVEDAAYEEPIEEE